MSGNPFTPVQPAVPLPGNLRPVQPFLARRGEFVPEVGKRLTLTLQGEVVGSEITEVINHDLVVAKITSIVTDKGGHGYRKDSVVPVQRKWNGMSEVWEPISDREVREQEAVDKAREMAQREQEQPIEVEPEPEPEVVAEAVPHGTEEPRRKVLGPRRSKISKPAPEVKRVPGPRRSRIARAS